MHFFIVYCNWNENFSYDWSRLESASRTQCEKSMIFVSLRFYVISVCRSKKLWNCLFCHFMGSKSCWFGKSKPSRSAKIHENQNSELVKMADFECIDLPTFIWRKSWMPEKKSVLATLCCTLDKICKLLYVWPKLGLKTYGHNCTGWPKSKLEICFGS